MCVCCVLFTILSRFNRISAVNTDCDIYLHTGENLYKRQKVILHLSRVPSGFSIRGGLHVFVLFSTVRCDTLVVGILVTTPWMCECLCVCV